MKPVPMTKLPVITTPFDRVAIDLVGPISPVSSGGHRYILTMIDYATSFPEAVAMKEITSIAVAEALIPIFSRVGIPREILSDRGSQFTSDLLGEVYRVIGTKPIFTTPYHPSANGRIERQHSILKSILKKLCMGKPSDWHRYLAPALFAMREVPSDTLGFSPFELLYGRRVRGPLSILHELWTDSDLDSKTRNTYQYVFELRNKLEDTAELVAKYADISMSKYKYYFDKKSSKRTFKTGDEVLLLLPVCSNKLLMTWKGPYKVLEVRNKVDILIDMNGNKKLFHANLVKMYHRRAHANLAYVADEKPTLDYLQICSSVRTTVIEDEPEPAVISINPELLASQKGNISDILGEFGGTFSEIPGCTSTVVHHIELKTPEPVRSKMYPVLVNLKGDFDKEINNLLDLGIISPSKSDYCSPVVMVKKPDGSYRVTQDFRALNSVTVFDAEPMPCIEEDLHKFSGARYFTELDLCKAYHQIRLSDQSKKYTAFPTSKGLMEYARLPFGLVTAGASYIKLMKIVLGDIPSDLEHAISVYYDNIFIATKEWDHHLEALRFVLRRLKKHGLTARPSKCTFGYPVMNYLGFTVSELGVSPANDKVEAINNVGCPQTKKKLRSFLGMMSFYRKFIPNLAKLSAPLSDMLKKDSKEPLKWSSETSDCFNKLKLNLTKAPILALPDLLKTFCIRSDASDLAIGGVLVQYHGEVPKPVSFISRKLSNAELNYSVIERECLALVWSIEKFSYYLMGTEFILETDHRPLTYLQNCKNSNPRIMRWALSLQPYKYRVVYIPGSENHGADFLSRL